MLHQVLKNFRAEDKDRTTGEIVETSGWRNWRLLQEHRFIGIPSDESQKSKPSNKTKRVEAEKPKPAKKNISKPPTVVSKVTKPSRPAVLRNVKRKPQVVKKASAARNKG